MTLAAALRSELDALGAAGLRPFDVHSHTGADVDGSTRSAEDQVRDLEPFGGRSAIFPFHVESGYGPENRRVLGEAGRHPEVLVPFARLDPRVEAGRERPGSSPPAPGASSCIHARRTSVSSIRTSTRSSPRPPRRGRP